MVAPPFPLWAWLVFGGLVLALLFFDLFVLHRDAREVPFREAQQGVRSYQSEPPPSLSPGPGQGSKENPSAGTQRS